MYNSAAALIIRIENTFRDEFGLRHRLEINSEESSESREFNFFFWIFNIAFSSYEINTTKNEFYWIIMQIKLN